MQMQEAEVIAINALGWLMDNDDLRPVFLGATGGSLDDIRANATDRDLLVSVLEFLTMDDAWVVAFCTAHNLAYEKPLAARYTLPGAEQVHWT